MKKQFRFFLVVVGLIGMGIAAHTQSYAGNGLSSSTAMCSLDKAIYKPHLVYKDYNLRRFLEITIKPEKSENIYPGSVAVYFYLNIYDTKTKELMSITTFPYGCTASGVPSCQSSIEEGGRRIGFKIFALNKDFSPAYSFVPTAQSPYALIFPDVGAIFSRVDWGESKSIKFPTPDKFLENAPSGMPEVWILDRCDRN